MQTGAIMISRRSLVSCILVLSLPLTLLAAEWPDSRAVEKIERMGSFPSLDNSPFADWPVFSSPNMTLPVLAYGHPVAVDLADPANSIRQMVQVSTGSQAEFAFQSVETAARLTYIHFRETREGLPVICGRLDGVLNARGELMRWTLRDYSTWPITQRHLLSAQGAAAALRGTQRAHWTIEKADRDWFPDHDRQVLRPAFWIRLAGDQPQDRWEGIVDAATGETLLEWSGIHTDVITGTIRGPYWQPYDFSDPQIAIHPHEWVTVNGDPLVTGNDGVFSYEAGSAAACSTMLRGPYVEVRNEDADPGRLSLNLNAPFSPFNWDWTLGNAVRGELNLYYHTTFIHDWYKVLDPAFNALDYPMPATCNVGAGYDNAYWNGYGIYFGEGSQYHDFAMFSDVIYHEYTHGVTDGIYPDGMLPYTGQPGAMNEAWSDYIACSINGDPLMGEYLDGYAHSYFRNLESHMVFPQNWVGEVHGDSPFISAPLWTIRQALGADLADSLAHFARYALSETFFDYLVAVLETDDNDGDLSNGTPHDVIIYNAFGDHGIGPGSDPQFAIEDVNLRADGQGQSIGDGDRFMEQGETAELTFTLQNAAPLYPPPATDVQIAVTTADPSITIAGGGQQSVALLPAGASFASAPVVLQFSSSAADHWVILNIDVVSNGGSVTFHYGMEFTLGTPHLLIVEDDPTSDVEHYVRDVVRAQERIYDRATLSAGQSLAPELYPQYGMVLWLSGNDSGNVLTTQDQAQIVAFLSADNKVVLSGQNIVDALSGSDFAQNVLGVEVLNDTVPSHAVTASGAPFASGEWYLLTGSGGAANQTHPDIFNVLGSSQEICHWGRAETGPAAGVLFADGKGVLLGFGIEGVSGMAGSVSRASLLNELYAWAGGLLGDVSEPSITVTPSAWRLGPAYPNPFNASTTILYSVPANAHGELIIYDVLGRLVQSLPLPSSSGVMQWAPHQTSGIYFAQVRWRDGQSEPIKLLQLR
jgi:hypothetical protein